MLNIDHVLISLLKHIDPHAMTTQRINQPWFGIALVLYAGVMPACSDITSKLPHATPYKVVSDRPMDPGNTGRTGRMCEITSDAKTFDEMAQTCILAAKDLSKKYRDDLVDVSLVPDKQLCGKGVYYATAAYARDTKGFLGAPGSDPNTDHKWAWRVSSAETGFSDNELEMVLLWYGHMKDFPSKEVYSSLSYDRKALTEYVAREMKCDVSEINIPEVTYKDYPFPQK
jgi:hypothetical protein